MYAPSRLKWPWQQWIFRERHDQWYQCWLSPDDWWPWGSEGWGPRCWGRWCLGSSDPFRLSSNHLFVCFLMLPKPLFFSLCVCLCVFVCMFVWGHSWKAHGNSFFFCLASLFQLCSWDELNNRRSSSFLILISAEIINVLQSSENFQHD